MRTSVNPDANFHCTCMLSSYLNDHGVGKAPSTADLSQGDESTFRLNFRASSQTSVIISFKSSLNMVSYHPTIADQLSVFFLHFPLQSSYATYVWSGPRCFFKNDRQNYLKKLFARCGSVVIIWSVMTTYLVHICKGNKLDTQTRLQCPQERRRVSAALTWQPICYIISQRSCSRINTCEIEQLFSAKKYAARTHFFSINGGKIISVHNTISWMVIGHGKQS